MKRSFSIVMIFTLLLLCISGCAKKNDGVPEGMYSVTREGEPFILYVQGDWTDNRDSGVSSAYIMSDGTVVSARSYGLEEGKTLSDYFEEAIATYESYTNYKPMTRDDKAMLGGKNAIKYQFSFDRMGTEGGSAVNTTVTQYYSVHKGEVILLSFYCASVVYGESYQKIFEQIRSEFVICDRKPLPADVADKDTPEGMKRVSFDGCEYLFYAPKSWTANMSDKLTEAECAEHGCNITVTAYLPEADMKIDEYFELCEKSYKSKLGGYERLSAADTKTAGKSARVYTYKASINGVEYKLSQTVLFFNDMFYSITYTSRAEHFEEHSAEVSKMLSEFSFH